MASDSENNDLLNDSSAKKTIDKADKKKKKKAEIKTKEQLLNEKLKKQEQVIEYHEAPAGRGKKHYWGTKAVPRKTRKHNDPSFLLSCIKTNPDNLTIMQYFDPNNIKRIYFHSKDNHRQLSEEERMRMLSGLFVSLLREKPSSSKQRFRIEGLIGDKTWHDLRLQILKDIRRYLRWKEKLK